MSLRDGWKKRVKKIEIVFFGIERDVAQDRTLIQVFWSFFVKNSEIGLGIRTGLAPVS